MPDILKPFQTTAVCGLVDALRHQVFLCKGLQVEIVTLTGEYIPVINFTEMDGCPTFLDLNGNFLSTGTEKGVVNVFNLAKGGGGGGGEEKYFPVCSSRN
eukprot:334773_1